MPVPTVPRIQGCRPGQEHPKHPGAMETDANICISRLINKHRGPEGSTHCRTEVPGSTEGRGEAVKGRRKKARAAPRFVHVGRVPDGPESQAFLDVPLTGVEIVSGRGPPYLSGRDSVRQRVGLASLSPQVILRSLRAWRGGSPPGGGSHLQTRWGSPPPGTR